MAIKSTTNTLMAFKDLLKNRQGGSLSYATSGYYPLSSPLYTWASKAPTDYLPFVISIHELDSANGSFGEDLVTLGFFINPSDLQIGNVYISSDQYTRGGWVSTLWGTQQATISANGSTAGFYHQAGNNTGITNFSRKDAVSFVNLLSLIGLFKNNGSNFSKAKTELELFKSGFSRIINVMDIIKISYDGSEYLGEFISFTLEEDATQPYKLNYSFEYVINGISADSPYIEGHVRTKQYDVSTPVIIGLQGSDSTIINTIQVNTNLIRENASISLSSNATILSEVYASTQDQYANAVDFVRDTTEEERKSSSALLQAQIDSGGRAVSKAGARTQIDNIRKYNNDVGKGKTAQQALDLINKSAGATAQTAVTIEQMNGILLLENNVGLAVTGFTTKDPAFPHPDTTSARGLTQVIKGTYQELLDKGFATFVNANFPEYTVEQIENAHPGKYGTGLLDEDPLIGYLAGAYYLARTINPRIVKDGYEVTPQISGLAYHNGPGSYNDKITAAGANYATSIDTYIDYLKDPNKSTNELR